jgi:hypothetical protein
MKAQLILARRKGPALKQRRIGAAVGIGADGLEGRFLASRNNSIFKPAAGLPLAVSSTCVVKRPIWRPFPSVPSPASGSRRPLCCRR